MSKPQKSLSPVPQCVPYEELQPGSPFNPYKVYDWWSARTALLRTPNLSLATKLFWCELANQVFKTGYDCHGQRGFADLFGIDRSLVRYHLAKLKKAGLLRVHRRPGKCDLRYLTWQKLFENCSPLGGLTYRPTVGQPISPLVGLPISPTSISNSFFITDVSVSRTESTGCIAIEPPAFAPPALGNGKNHKPTGPTWTIDGRRVYLQDAAQNFWKTLEPTAKENRKQAADRAARLLIQAELARENPNPETAEQGRKDYHEHVHKLSDTGFAITPKTKKTHSQ